MRGGRGRKARINFHATKRPRVTQDEEEEEKEEDEEEEEEGKNSIFR